MTAPAGTSKVIGIFVCEGPARHAYYVWEQGELERMEREPVCWIISCAKALRQTWPQPHRRKSA